MVCVCVPLLLLFNFGGVTVCVRACMTPIESATLVTDQHSHRVTRSLRAAPSNRATGNCMHGEKSVTAPRSQREDNGYTAWVEMGGGKSSHIKSDADHLSASVDVKHHVYLLTYLLSAS